MITISINDLINEEDRERMKNAKELEKELEEKIKVALEEVQDWVEIESSLIREKLNVLKLYEQEVHKERSRRVRELHEMYGSKKCESVRQKYKLKNM